MTDIVLTSICVFQSALAVVFLWYHTKTLRMMRECMASKDMVIKCWEEYCDILKKSNDNANRTNFKERKG
jgi:hypothetical protein